MRKKLRENREGRKVTKEERGRNRERKNAG
jgi:hypothetical protein